MVEFQLKPFKARRPDLDLAVEYHTPATSAALFALLGDIAKETKAVDGRPIIHLEIHGRKPGVGLALEDESTVLWAALTEHLLAINTAARNNLIVVLAVCWGERLFEIFPHSERAPVFGLVGPTDETTFGRFEDGFRAFYSTLLETGDGDRAVQDLNTAGAEKDPSRSYRWHSAEGAFRDHFRLVLEEKFGSATKRKAVVETAITNARQTARGRALGLGEVRRLVKAAARRAGKKSFEKLRDRYLMFDLLPEHRPRFTLRYEDCVPPERL